MMKVAVIGVGSISDCHLDSYVKNPETELYAICLLPWSVKFLCFFPKLLQLPLSETVFLYFL